MSAKRKRTRAHKYHTEQATDVTGVSTDVVESHSDQNEDQERSENKEKALDLDKLYLAIKEKIQYPSIERKLGY